MSNYISHLEPHQITALAVTDKNLHPDLMLLLSSQIRDSSKPFDGCFGANPTGETPWLDNWDPNSRVLVPLIISIGLAVDAWPEAIKTDIAQYAKYAIQAEMRQNRVPVTYTNVAISLAASCLFLGNYFQDISMHTYALNLIEKITSERISRGGFHEFNSPTYLGLSLLAASFIEQSSQRKFDLLDLLSSDLYSSWDESIIDIIGPSMRSYGASIHTHYSLSLIALAPDLALNYNPEQHLGDRSFKEIYKIINPFDPKRVAKVRPRSMTIKGVAEITSSYLSRDLHLGAANYNPDSWHHQSTNATIHTKGGALTLRHPSIKTEINNNVISWSSNNTQESGNPHWLWGSLTRPEKSKITTGNIKAQGYNISLLDPTHIKISSTTLLVNPPVIINGDSITLNPSEGSITIL